MITNSDFRSAFGLSNPHLQTLLPFFIKKRNTTFLQQTLELDDGDFLDLSWTEKAINGKPVVVVFHGLEGSIESHYASGIMRAIKQRGWCGVLMHFRGCSGRLNRLARSYHSGETSDARYLLSWLAKQYPGSDLGAIGYSLGGNVLLKLQAEYGENSPLSAGVSICAPIQLGICANRMDKGFSRLYQRHLISHLKQKILSKSKYIDYQQLIGMSPKDVMRLKTFWQFDDNVTAPLHGFKGVDDYYQQSSSRQYLRQITTPNLMLHALDDPFMTPDLLPDNAELSSSIGLELSPHGGHIGFMAGTAFKPNYWLEKRITHYLESYIS